ncbi:MAG: hypothetical protein U5J95_05755 [Balneolaceae bacterium]|nr:hypothetical protein [Balneolaceae bacterium]
MTTKFKKLKEQLSSLEDGDLISEKRLSRRRGMLSKLGIYSPSWLRYGLLVAFLGSFLFYAGSQFAGSTTSVNPLEEFSTWVNQPDEELLQGMDSWMEEMGYTDLTREELIDLRQQGVTATFTSKMRDLGYTDLTLEELVSLSQNDVSATFSAMMKELGYDLTIEELIQLRQHDVTAFYTSNMHDLGYTELTKDELIRLRDTGVSTSMVERLIEERGTQPTVEELIRYRISNQ